LPLAAVEAESRRLCSARHQARLGRAVDELADIADRHRLLSPPAAVVRQVSTLGHFVPELREIALPLLTGAATVEGVALVERLLIFGDSPLYGADVEPLRRELRRVRTVLSHRS
jgi:hypothetical protein